MLDGLIILDKPAGLSSARAVGVIRRLLPRGIRVGHAGTLDRFATGVLVLLVGSATKRSEQVMSWLKTYQATIKLGATTDTDDPDSPEKPWHSEPLIVPTREVIDENLMKMVGVIEQRPPLYSALKIDGRRASDRARRGSTNLDIKPRIVNVYRIEVLAYEWPLLRLRIDCGRGTYVRSIARDLGEKLNVGGHVTVLRRTAVGQCTIDQAVSLDRFTSETLPQYLQRVML